MSRSDWSISDWFHCNSCYRQHSLKGDDPRNKFHFTSCGHIYCASCVDADPSRKCKLCGSTFKTMIISKNMRPDIQCYFQDPKSLIRKGVEILKFQGSHQRRLLANRSKHKGDSKVEKENAMLRKEIAYLKRVLSEKQQRPGLARSPAHTAHVSPQLHSRPDGSESQMPQVRQIHQMQVDSHPHPPPPHHHHQPQQHQQQRPHPPMIQNPVPQPRPGPSSLTHRPELTHQPHPQVNFSATDTSSSRVSPYSQASLNRQLLVHTDDLPRRPPGRITITTPPFDAKRGTIVPSPISRRDAPQSMEASTPRQSPTNRPIAGYMSVAHPLPSFSPLPSPSNNAGQGQSRNQPGLSSESGEFSHQVRNYTNAIPLTPGVVRETSLSRFKAANSRI